MRWFLLIVFVLIAALAGGFLLWREELLPYLGPRETWAATLATVIAAVFTIASFVQAIVINRAQKRPPKSEGKTINTNGGAVIRGNVKVKYGDFVGRDKFNINQNDYTTR